MGKTFQKVHGCSVGNFESNGEKIPQWIRANGGTYSKDISEEVTHLITTKEAYKRNVDAVRQAKKRKGIKIVTYDWLEDSLLSKTRRPKPEKPYLLETIIKNERPKGKKDASGKKGKRTQAQTSKSNKRKRAVPQSLEAFEKASSLSTKTKMEALNYHLYTERYTNTTYSATLVRPTLVAGQREKNLVKSCNSSSIFPIKPLADTKVPIDNPRAQQIQVYESNKVPHVYAVYLKYSRVGKSETYLLAPTGSKLDFAMRAFKDFFKLKTGKEWDERFGEKLVPPMRDSEGNILPAHEGWFRFEDQIGILASFMRYAPPVVGGENGQGPESRVDGSFSAQNQGIPGSEMQDEEKGGEESDRVGIGEPCGEDDMVALKRLKTEVGMAAVLIDR